MNALSRREEETLLKKTKAFALKACDPIVKVYFTRTSLGLEAQSSSYMLYGLSRVREAAKDVVARSKTSAADHRLRQGALLAHQGRHYDDGICAEK
ncbi:hypothetical protein TRAPUB_12118 [Trametes pubescens]|uniref:Uncharacterized protein n=1 Tax=Trametes pubescens TaxID=154538 RepID=A0A1M2VUT6_TRAPU|nr:hypothetical protein TRAPUB_12118 [Trametes pubescens]